MKRTETTVEIVSLANGGDGVGKLPDGRVVFVPRALPGDHVRVILERDKKRWARGRIVEVTTPSDDRIAPKCQHFEACGGCAFQHFRYAAELTAKTGAAREAMRRIAKIELPPGEQHGAAATSGYRIRARLCVSSGSFGYRGRGSHKVFKLKRCPVLDPVLEAVIGPLSDAVRGADGEVLIETAGNDELVVVLRGEFNEDHAKAVFAIPTVRGVRFGALLLGSPDVDASEAWDVEAEEVLEAGRFRQANAAMGQVLRELTTRRVGTGELLVELFAGSGNFTHALADAFGQVTAYELDVVAVDLGNRVAAQTSSNVQFIAANLDTDPPEIPAGATILLDPPRVGAAAACDVIAESGASRVVYVSCDVATLARDTRTLVEAGFTPIAFDLVDMFPRTPHIEAIATFTRLSD